jgi:hypothetical protein
MVMRKSIEEYEREGREELKRYGGKPSRESTSGEVPDYLLGKQDYRYHPGHKKYKIFDTEKGQFLVDMPGPESSEGPGYRLEKPEPLDLSIEKTRPLDLSIERPERMTDEDMRVSRSRDEGPYRTEKPNPLDLEVKRSLPGAPPEVRRTAEDLRNAEDFLKVLSARERSIKKTKKK